MDGRVVVADLVVVVVVVEVVVGLACNWLMLVDVGSELSRAMRCDFRGPDDSWDSWRVPSRVPEPLLRRTPATGEKGSGCDDGTTGLVDFDADGSGLGKGST